MQSCGMETESTVIESKYAFEEKKTWMNSNEVKLTSANPGTSF